MENYYPLKMKRKDFEDVYDEFNDFPLSSPARKIRRLDAELPPIVEDAEEEPVIPIAYKQVATDQRFGNGPLIEELPSVPENEERAIVVFKPMNTPFVQSPSNFCIKVNPQYANGFKNQVLWGSHTGPWKHADDEPMRDNSSGSSSECLAVVPWVPSQLPSADGAEEVVGQPEIPDMMEAEDMDGVTMDVEESCVNAEQRAAGAASLSEGLHQWQQQHCMIPQPPHNTSTPIVWYP